MYPTCSSLASLPLTSPSLPFSISPHTYQHRFPPGPTLTQLNLTLETLLGLDDPRVVLRRNSMSSLSDGQVVVPPGMQWKRVLVVVERTGLALFCVIVAMLIPDFSRVMAFLGCESR